LLPTFTIDDEKMSAKELDPYTQSALSENAEVTLKRKVEELTAIVKEIKTSMVTTRSKSGDLHSRAMTPCAPHHDETGHGLHFLFFANNTSHKFDEIDTDDHVNVSFYNHTTTDWASVSGKARITQDKKLIKEHWSSYISSYFGDLGDGIHNGKPDDPRISIIEVIPSEIRYWVSTSGTIGRAVGAAYGAVTGHPSVPGEMRTLTSEEIQQIGIGIKYVEGSL